MDERISDCKQLFEECGFGTLDTEAVLKNIAHLEEFYDSETLSEIYNYALKTINNPSFLMQIIKYSDLHKSESTLLILLNILKNGIENIPEQLSDDYTELRVLCVKAIANYKDTNTISVLLDCLNNKKESYRVRFACADALGKIGSKSAVQPLINVIKDEGEKSVYLKESATSALGLLGDIAAIEPLISILESKHGFADKFAFLKEKIVEALGKLNINNTKILDALSHSLMDSSPIVRINAIEAIMNSGDSRSVDLIRPCLDDCDNEVKKNALIALYNLCGRDILDEIISLPGYNDYLKQEAQNLIDEYEGDE